MVKKTFKKLLELNEVTNYRKLAIELGCNPSCITKYVNGERIPKPAQVVRMAKCFGMSIGEVAEYCYSVLKESK